MALYDNEVALEEYNRSDDNNNDDVLMYMWFKKERYARHVCNCKGVSKSM